MYLNAITATLVTVEKSQVVSFCRMVS